MTEWDEAVRLGIAALIGAGVGLEREWSGHASGPQARFAGLRTFLLLGLFGGCAGLLLSMSYGGIAAVMVGGGMALAVAAYVTSQRRPDADPDGTTEAAALVVIALGAVAGTGAIELAAGAGSIVVFVLSEKARLHRLVGRLGDAEMHAALEFSVLALVILPLLPSGPLWGAVAVRPRALWSIVLLLSALNFVGFIARRALGANRGYTVTGMLGGIVSSTAVTLSFARQSRRDEALSASLAHGVIGACTVLVPRVLVVSAVLNPPVALALARFLAAPFAVGLLILAFGWRRQAPSSEPETPPGNPLRLGAAMRMAIAFQVALTVIAFARDAWGTKALYASGAVLGLTDVDALTVSMSQIDAGVLAGSAARAIAIGILANTMMKLGMSVALGSPPFRRAAASGLVGLAAASTLGLWLA